MKMIHSNNRQAFLETFLRNVLFTVVLFALTLNVRSVIADTHQWTNASGVYGVSTNWSPNGFPSSVDTALFNLANDYEVTFNQSRTINSIFLRNTNHVTLSSGGSLAGDRTYTTNILVVEPTGAKLSVDPGSSTHNMILDVNGSLQVSGVLSLRNGAQVTSSSGSVGNTTTAGTINIEGTSSAGQPSRWETNTLAVHPGGVYVRDGAGLSSIDVNIHSGVGEVNGSGSVWTTTDQLTVGGSGLSVFRVFDGGRATTETAVLYGTAVLQSNHVSEISTFTTTGNLYAGGNQQAAGTHGKLDVLENASAEIMGTLKLWPNGRVDISEFGVLSADVIQNKLGGAFNFDGGELVVNQYEGDLVNTGGALTPGGQGFATTFILGDYTCTPNASLAIDIGGTTAGSTYDLVNMTGQALINGQFKVFLEEGYVPSPSDSYVVMIAESTFGNFDNVVNGERIDIEDGGGSFIVNYGFGSPFEENRVVLSDYQPPASPEVTPESMTVILGVLASGTAIELGESDNSDVVLRRSATDVHSRTQFEVTSTSPIANPSTMTMTVEGSVFARRPVAQTVHFYNYAAGFWEDVDNRSAQRFSDSVATVTVGGDVSRFIETGSNEMKARILFRSSVARQSFSSNTDLIEWTVED